MMLSSDFCICFLLLILLPDRYKEEKENESVKLSTNNDEDNRQEF